LLFPLALSKDFLQALSFNSHASAGGLGHLLREFNPVHSHIHRIRPSWSRLSAFFEEEATPLRAKEAGSVELPGNASLG
jgi:hypothetical protein